MAIQKLSIEDFLKLAHQYPVFDVRSPGEYNHAHITDAISLPLFTDEERKAVGTAYKQQSKEAAIKIGLDFFGTKMKAMVEEVEKMTDDRWQMTAKLHPTINYQPSTINILVHCWRGGMRSAGVAWLLDLYGFKVYTLAGGYKAYRKWVLQQFEKEYPFTIIGGYTGSGKTLLLHQLQQQQKKIIDLEALANHKGSAFGSVGTQPVQEMFENLLAERLADVSWSLVERNASQANNEQQSTAIYLEDESQRIGNIQIPMPLWNTMRKSPILFLNIPFEERLNYITEEYGKGDKEKLVNSIIRIQKRLGGLETKNAINFILEDNYRESFRILLRYYDKWYEKALNNRENLNTLLNKIPCTSVDTIINTQKLLLCHSASV